MKTAIIYSSQTGFTERYARWLAEELGGDLFTVREADGRDGGFWDGYDAIAYGGWALGGKAHRADFLLSRCASWADKRLALFCVGASPAEKGAREEIEDRLRVGLTEEQRARVAVFYCPGGLNYERMPAASRLAMRLFAAAHRMKRNRTAEDREKADLLSRSYDITDRGCLDRVARYLTGAPGRTPRAAGGEER